MEGRIKRYKVDTTVSVSWLNLHEWIQQRDIRKLIYRLLDSVDWQIVQYAHTGKGIETDLFIEECAVRGHFELVKWGVAQSYQMIDVRMCHCAVQGGNLKIIQWLQTNGHTIECSLSLCEIAAGYGQLEVLKWLLLGSLGMPYCCCKWSFECASMGYLQMVVQCHILPFVQ